MKHLESIESLEFDDNRLLPNLYGEQDKHLEHIAKSFGVEITSRGNEVIVKGEKSNVDEVKKILGQLYNRLKKGQDVSFGEVEACIRLRQAGADASGEGHDSQALVIKTINRIINPYSVKQQSYLRLLHDKEMVFAEGPAGTGKTYLAVAAAVSMYLNHQVERIILSRPAIEAGEKIGFLPGDMKDKIDPYMQPLYDALFDMMPFEKVQKNLATGVFEVAPLAFMRGRTFKHAFVILDEAQNATPTQMKMFVTRLGTGSRMVINGDLSQIDLPSGMLSGLTDALEKLKKIKDIGFLRFDEKDVIRHALVGKIIKAYKS